MMADKGGLLGMGLLGGKKPLSSRKTDACVRDLVHAAVWTSKAHSQAWQASLVHPEVLPREQVPGQSFTKWKELRLSASLNTMDARTALERVARECMPQMEGAVNLLLQAETLFSMLPQPTLEHVREARIALGAAEQHIMRTV